MQKFRDFLVDNFDKMGNVWADLYYKEYKKQNKKSTLTREKARDVVRDFKIEKGIKAKGSQFQKNSLNINDDNIFLSMLEKGKNYKSISELALAFKVTEFEIQNKINKLRIMGYNISEVRGVVILEKNIIPKENVHKYDWQGSEIITFGVVSDTHLCSKDQQLTHLKDFYNVCKDRGIKDVYHAGDITDGFNKGRGDHIYQTFCVGADDQVNYVVKHYPKVDGIKTHFIIGNHDAWHITNGGIDIGKMIASRREDMNYLGCLNAVINLTPNCTMEINHPLDGASYALSYSIQKYMDSMSGGQKPNILINGHHHKMLYMFYRNIHAIEAGCFEAQTAWMKGKRISAHVGGFIVTVHVDSDGSITNFLPEAIVYFDSIKGDY